MIPRKAKLPQEVIAHREQVRSVYRSGYGPKELFNIFHDGGLFRIISPEELDARNRAIRKAEEIGLLDEDVIRGMLDSFLGDRSVLNAENRRVLEENKTSTEDMKRDIFTVHDIQE